MITVLPCCDQSVTCWLITGFWRISALICAGP